MDITTGYLGIFAVKKLSYEEEKIIPFWTAKKKTQPKSRNLLKMTTTNVSKTKL